ncbi:hypothetical protein QWY86_00385 [Pedobacter aquatilis]|uniref:hypothetical protein n=1 Tax=Pedobacter aquatilis TaxID=351343 RepID=UPI0025B50197|nr:hypothetical protein [Pedobacter aquatilis]MDN3585106.1 hypothetical protein [Pedobacter aquatilis]
MKETILNFQYQYSKLFNLGLNRKKFEINATADKLFAMNTSKNTFIALFFTLFASGHLFSGLIVGLSSTEKLDTDFYLAFTILFIVGLIGFRQFLWLVNGRQELTIENGTLMLTKNGTFFTKPKSYTFDKVENIRQAFDEDSLSLFDKIQKNIGVNRKVIFGHIYGQVLFDYNQQTVKIFCDLDKDERLKLIDEMKKQK